MHAGARVPGALVVLSHLPITLWLRPTVPPYVGSRYTLGRDPPVPSTRGTSSSLLCNRFFWGTCEKGPKRPSSSLPHHELDGNLVVERLKMTEDGVLTCQWEGDNWGDDFSQVKEIWLKAQGGETGGNRAKDYLRCQLLQRFKRHGCPPTKIPFSTTSWVAASMARKKTLLPYCLEADMIFGAPTPLAFAYRFQSWAHDWAVSSEPCDARWEMGPNCLRWRGRGSGGLGLRNCRSHWSCLDIALSASLGNWASRTERQLNGHGAHWWYFAFSSIPFPFPLPMEEVAEDLLLFPSPD